MRKRILTVLGAALLLTGVGLVATTGVANAATLAYDINGSWTVNGPEAPRITSSGGSISIDMSYAGRPTATGTVVNSSTIQVTFPDAGTFTAQVLSSTQLSWSNGTRWAKVFSGDMLFPLTGYWGDSNNTEFVFNNGGHIQIFMDHGRPTAYGWAIDFKTIIIFFPDDRTYIATLMSGPFIAWNNGSNWVLIDVT